ncbi:MAG: hypothetical protein IT369_07460 [Candidatus Latescibacteria bacterium]|nr:hypothetical protein [Candidatus Latescibacterota bacterium]
MPPHLHNPYANPQGTWVRGSLHGHCCEHSACASVPLAESVRQYRDLGAGFVALTDHDVVTDLSALRAQYPELILLHGFEYSTRENVLFIGPEVEPLYRLPLEQALAAATDLLTVVCHPRPYASGREYWSLAKLAALGAWPDGVEVYNGHYGHPTALALGRWPFYAPFWDELLSAGHRLWGFANDDFHDPEDFGNAFNMVLVEERTPAAVVAAAKAGRCYASTGLLLHEVAVRDEEISVQTAQPCTGRFLGPGGAPLSQGEGTRFTYRAGEEAYVRFEAEGEAGRLFLQPMFRQPA